MSVEPEMDDRVAGEMARARPCFPLRPGKVQRPLVPDETLRRDRLLDWMAARANRRVIYVIAEAGFGKTTLVADYLRRSQLRAFWYRLDDDDTDGLVFLRYLVAACQAVDSGLLVRSASLLSESSLEPAPAGAVLDTILSELSGLGEMPSVLVLDDFHMVEGVPAVGSIVERLIARSPERLRFILASRRTPNLSVAALRARGELAELNREQLRFDEVETDRLFRDSYKHPLEPDVLHDLHTRTEGWAASLQLVKTAVDGRSPAHVRAFVDSLSGSEGDLYDYLAEEVVGDLDPALRAFLVRTALLEDVEPDTAAVAASVPPGRARHMLGEAQRLGLLSRDGDRAGIWRSHPLVREFLLAHLEAELGQSGVAAMHRRLATMMEQRSWRLAARHWAAAGDGVEVRRVVCAATPTIIGTGDLAAADEFVTRFPDPKPNPWFDIIESRLHAAAGRYDEAAAAAMRAEMARGQLSDASASLDQAHALNQLHLGIQRHDPEMRKAASLDLASSGDLELVSIARSADLMCEASDSGSLDSLCTSLAQTARLNRERGHTRHEGVSLLNLSCAELARGNHPLATAAAMSALELLGSAGNCGDSAAAHLSAARGLAHGGPWADAVAHLDAAIEDANKAREPDGIAEAAELHAMYGSPAKGSQILKRALVAHPHWADGPHWRLTAARLELVLAGPESAAELLSKVTRHTICPGFVSAFLSLELQIRSSFSGAGLSADVFRQYLRFAERQQAWFWSKTIRLTQALASATSDLAAYVASMDKADAPYLSIQAELVTARLAELDQLGFGLVRDEACRAPERWRSALRDSLTKKGPRPQGVSRAVELLEIAGDAEDIGFLRSIGKRSSPRLPDSGRGLIRRLAPRVYVEDLGRVSVKVGDRIIPGTDIRRKVLSLLCFLLSRPQLTSTREQVLEALWPEMDPEAGANSLNQSTYFLRRILEPGCEDDTSAGYLRSRADLIWLDPELVRSRSSECLELMQMIRRDPAPEFVVKLAESYKGRFAADFIYDDWASAFRDSLHAAFLDRVERAITSDTNAGAFDRALCVAQLAMQADPDAEQIELCLLKLYRRTGANAAAAEQYAHYASVLRDQLGMEPPPLDSI